MLTTIIILVVAAILVLYLIAIYNGLVQLRNNINKSLGNIDVLLKQRYDELPNLIETCKGYMKHEKSVFENITKARSAWMKSTTLSQKASASDMLSGALKSLFAVAENYPKLEANVNFKHLQERISGIENEVADRREFYNDSVNNFNIRIQSFPDLFIARMMALSPFEMFKASEEEKKVVKVKF
ncbi:MAG: LemA family protein [Candidatus Aenigmarchaeota archaeon]|nr:LemA family protein [Candidatus Aenigmarchaeota archaeon]